MLFDTFIRLRKEAHKTWEHTISDETVYCFKNFDRHTDTALVGYDKAIAMNLRGRWWEIVLEHRDGDFYCVLIEPMQNPSGFMGNSEQLPGQGDRPVLVTVREFMQQPQGMRGGIRCGVWLKRLDDLTGIFGDVLQDSIRFFEGLPVRWSLNDGEFRQVIRGRGCEQSQLPSDVVKTGMKVMENVTNHGTFAPGNIAKFNSIDISRLIRVGVSATDEWLGVLPCADETIKRLEVLRRPVEFQPWPIEFVHMLYSKYEGQEDAYTKDTKRPRNPCANKGRRVQSAGKGGTANHSSARTIHTIPPITAAPTNGLITKAPRNNAPSVARLAALVMKPNNTPTKAKPTPPHSAPTPNPNPNAPAHIPPAIAPKKPNQKVLENTCPINSGKPSRLDILPPRTPASLLPGGR